MQGNCRMVNDHWHSIVEIIEPQAELFTSNVVGKYTCLRAATGDPNGGSRPEWKTYRSDFDVDLLCNQTHMLPSDQSHT